MYTYKFNLHTLLLTQSNKSPYSVIQNVSSREVRYSFMCVRDSFVCARDSFIQLAFFLRSLAPVQHTQNVSSRGVRDSFTCVRDSFLQPTLLCALSHLCSTLRMSDHVEFVTHSCVPPVEHEQNVTSRRVCDSFMCVRDSFTCVGDSLTHSYISPFSVLSYTCGSHSHGQSA